MSTQGQETQNEGALIGRPSKYREEYAEQAYRLCLLGLTDAELGTAFDVTEQTINNWKNDFPQFFESIKRGKLLADGNVADRLFQRAIGYSHPDTHFSSYEGVVTETDTVKHYPPDTTAAIFWLKNRQRKHWRDKTEVETSLKQGSDLKAWTAEEIDAFDEWQQRNGNETT